jgi:ornithine cyclodeaminase/alanine dehydrogenase-like protein (mu-crystallin family)
MTVHFLSLSDVLEVGLTFDDALGIVGASLRAHGEKRVENPPKVSVHPCPDAFITAMPAHLPDKGVCGVKWVSGFPTNVPKGLTTITGVIVLNDPQTGLPLAVLDGTYITALRTVAVSAVAAKHLCNPNAAVLGIVGCGVQGKYHAVGMRRMLPSLSVVRIFDRHEPSIHSFIAEVRQQVSGLRIEVCATAAEAIRDADLVITATGKLLRPIFKCAWVKAGALVLPVHTQGWDDAILTQMNKLVVDDWAQFTSYAGGFYRCLPDHPDAETGEIVAGLKQGREHRHERIVNFNTGLAIHDILMAGVILEKAKTQGLGTPLTLQEAGQQLPMLRL